MAIEPSDLNGRFTKGSIDVYKEKIEPLGFLRSFFPEKTSPTKLISYDVTRTRELIAEDIASGTEGDRVQSSISTEKVIDPPEYGLWQDITKFDIYDKARNSTNPAVHAALAEKIGEDLAQQRAMIERAYELQCAQVLETGVVVLKNGTNIDFKRKSGSLVDLTSAGGYWSTISTDVFAQIQAGCQFLRQTGKAQGTVFNLILGSTSYSWLMKNTAFIATANIRRIDHVSLRMPQKSAVGATSHGEFGVGDYIVRLWTYPEIYDTASVKNNPYVNAKKGILIPENPRFCLSYAAVPQIIKGNAENIQAAYVIDEMVDEWHVAHKMRVRSRGVAVPVAVDQIYTFQTVA